MCIEYIFLISKTRIVKCVLEYIFLISKTQKTTRRQRVKETKEEKIISAVNLTGYDDIFCKFVLCTFIRNTLTT